MINRRDMIKQSFTAVAVMGCMGVFPRKAFADYNQNAFTAKTVADVLKAENAGKLTESADVTLGAPDIAENGAVVPMSASCKLPGVKKIMFLVEKNPSTLIAVFNVTDSIEANFSTRAKMGQSSDVYAVALMDDGRALYAKKEVKVTLGGCGG